MKRIFLVLLGFFGCIGTDYIDDPIIGESIIIMPEGPIALMPGEQATIMAEYFDKYGIMRDVMIQWQSSNPFVAQVNSSGVIFANADGQAIVQPSYGNFLGPQVQVTVVSDMQAVATVEVDQPANTNLTVGDKVQLQATVKNINGDVLEGRTVEWFSENNSIVTVSQSGLVEAVGSGIADVHAKSEGVKSNLIKFAVNGMVRTGTFVSAGGYHTSGSARLEVVNNQLVLTLSDNFDTDFALGTYIYLANSTNGGTVRTTGFEVAQIFTDGGKTFNISQLNPNIGLNDYRYVIALCKPASVTFGYADLK